MSSKLKALISIAFFVSATGAAHARNYTATTICSLEPEIVFARYRADLFGVHAFPGWFKPKSELKEYKGSSLLIIKLRPDGSGILNPTDEDGRSINAIKLKGLKKEDAVMVWGEPRESTFDLIADCRPEMDVFHMDTKFENGILSAYRLRGIGISNPTWITVE